MTFTDDLTLVLDLLILVTVVAFYTGVMAWFEMGRNDRVRALSHLKEGTFLLGCLGGLLGIIALWGEFTWPLGLVIGGTNVLGAYDLLFFDSLVLLAFVLVSFAIAVQLKRPTHMVGLVAGIAGGAILFYGYRAYNLSLTLDPLPTFFLFLGFGVLAIAVYPVSLYIDWFVVGPTEPSAEPLPSSPVAKYPWMWRVFLGGFLLLVFLSGVAALYYGYNTAWAHLGAPP
jgi:putative membrane protein